MIGISTANRKPFADGLTAGSGSNPRPGGYPPRAGFRPSTSIEPNLARGAGDALYTRNSILSQRLRSIGYLKAHDLITSPAYIVSQRRPRNSRTRAHGATQLWQTDFTYLEDHGVGLVLSLHRARPLLALHCRLEALRKMKAQDVTATLDLALAASGLDQMTVSFTDPGCCRIMSRHMSRAISQSGSDQQKMEHVRGAPYHPQTQGKIERWHQTLKNCILLEHFYLPGDLERPGRRLRRGLQPCPLSREPRQSHSG